MYTTQGVFGLNAQYIYLIEHHYKKKNTRNTRDTRDKPGTSSQGYACMRVYVCYIPFLHIMATMTWP